MRARDRCRDNFQGDRCVLPLGHETGDASDAKVHGGNFTIWDDTRAVTRDQFRMHHKRNRAANRDMRLALSYNGPREGLKPVIEVLNRLYTFFGGKE